MPELGRCLRVIFAIDQNDRAAYPLGGLAEVLVDDTDEDLAQRACCPVVDASEPRVQLLLIEPHELSESLQSLEKKDRRAHADRFDKRSPSRQAGRADQNEAIQQIGVSGGELNSDTPAKGMAHPNQLLVPAVRADQFSGSIGVVFGTPALWRQFRLTKSGEIQEQVRRVPR